MSRVLLVAAVVFGAALVSRARAGAPPPVNETTFVASCRAETLRELPASAAWVERRCSGKGRRVAAAAPMAETIIALARAGNGTTQHGNARTDLRTVRWSTATDGTLGDVVVYLSHEGRIAFRWQETGSGPRYDLVSALRIRGASLTTLGCPKYALASMGAEKVIAVALPGRSPFTLTVYSRPAPTGIELGLYDVDVDFSETPPDMNALREGSYPGGGGRAFAADPVEWVMECPDPE